jgi:SAM-dependent methyltransferase
MIHDDYNRIAEQYANHLGKELEAKPLDRELLLRLAEAAAGRGVICDIGCGPGQVARFLRDAGADVFGLDISAQERGPYAPEVEHQSLRAYIFARKPETAWN